MFRNASFRSVVTGFSVWLSLGIGNRAHANGELLLSIPPGNAPVALNEFAAQTGIQVLYDYEIAKHWRTRAVAGAYNPLDAMGIMLRDTALTFDATNSRTITVLPGTQYCQPWLSPQLAPLPPCMQLPPERRGAVI